MFPMRKKMIIIREQTFENDHFTTNFVCKVIGRYVLNGGDMSKKLFFMENLIGILDVKEVPETVQLILDSYDEIVHSEDHIALVNDWCNQHTGRRC